MTNRHFMELTKALRNGLKNKFVSLVVFFTPILGGSSQDLDTWLITMVSKSLSRVVGSLPNGRFIANKWG